MPLPILPLALAAGGILAAFAAGGPWQPAPGPGPLPLPPKPKAPTLDQFRDMGLPSSVWDYQRSSIERWAQQPNNLAAFARWCVTVGSPGPAIGALYVAQVIRA